MKKFKSLLVTYVFFVAGCAAVGVPYTSDPYEKLSYANDLYQNQNRAIPAERLFIESINIFKNNKDETGMAYAHRAYGVFLISDSVSGEYSGYFQKNGFLDKETTFKNRYHIAIKHLNLSLELFTKLEFYDAPININYVMGRIYWLGLNDIPEACSHFDKALNSYHALKAISPKEKIGVPEGFNNYEEFTIHIKKEAGCNSV